MTSTESSWGQPCPPRCTQCTLQCWGFSQDRGQVHAESFQRGHDGEVRLNSYSFRESQTTIKERTEGHRQKETEEPMHFYYGVCVMTVTEAILWYLHGHQVYVNKVSLHHGVPPNHGRAMVQCLSCLCHVFSSTSKLPVRVSDCLQGEGSWPLFCSHGTCGRWDDIHEPQANHYLPSCHTGRGETRIRLILLCSFQYVKNTLAGLHFHSHCSPENRFSLSSYEHGNRL